ncbi:MAG: hypothetical protein ACAH65_07815 [Chloroflexota bacterium]
MKTSPRRNDTVLATPEHPQLAAIEAEAGAWYELADLIRSLRPAERLQPGYYRGPDWSVRDLAAHVGTWLAEADVQFQRMLAGTYEGHEVDVDALNASLLGAVIDQPWTVVWTQANAARTTMRAAWFSLREGSAETDWWIAKAGALHYEEHLARLREWVAELESQRRR